MRREVIPVTYSETKAWILEKHYAKRRPSISLSFGLYIEGVLEGIVCFGSPPSQALCRGICGPEYRKDVLELNRLVINSGVPKNSASFLVSHAFKLLPKKRWIIVSYADTSMGHVGYIYQATNFIYTGLSDKRTEWRMKGCNKHSKTICEKYSLKQRKESDSFYLIDRPRKHRYILFIGDRREKRKMLQSLRYLINEYPKGESKKYDSPNVKNKQTSLNLKSKEAS